MTTNCHDLLLRSDGVVEAYRLDRYDNLSLAVTIPFSRVVEAYRLDRYDNSLVSPKLFVSWEL